jgi:hypothetical protein
MKIDNEQMKLAKIDFLHERLKLIAPGTMVAGMINAGTNKEGKYHYEAHLLIDSNGFDFILYQIFCAKYAIQYETGTVENVFPNAKYLQFAIVENSVFWNDLTNSSPSSND